MLGQKSDQLFEFKFSCVILNCKNKHKITLINLVAVDVTLLNLNFFRGILSTGKYTMGKSV